MSSRIHKTLKASIEGAMKEILPAVQAYVLMLVAAAIMSPAAADIAWDQQVIGCTNAAREICGGRS